MSLASEEGRRRVALTIAGSDSSGGAGIGADLKTFEAYGVWGAVAISAVTAQNTLGVQAFDAVTPELVRAQIASVVTDLGVDAAKTGMLVSSQVVESVTHTLAELGVGPVVVDPVLVATTGEPLLDVDGIRVLRRSLLPLAAVVTPNLAEAEALTGRAVSDRAGMVDAARALVDMGVGAALVKGGHLPGDQSPDCLLVADLDPVWLESARLIGRHNHGTGCVLSAAICAGLAHGLELLEACRSAKAFVARALAGGVNLGAGRGSVDPGGARWDRGG